MNLFKKHSQQNEEQAKQAIFNVVKLNLSKYIIAQKVLSVALSGGEVSKPKGKKGKKKNCLTCQSDYILSRMATYNNTVSEAVKTYRLMFGLDLDIDSIIIDCAKELYPALGKAKFKSKKESSDGLIDDDGFIIPEDAPAEVKSVFDAIRDALEKNGLASGIKMEVINTSGDNYGLKQEDFEDFGSFAKAVSAARKLNKKMESGEKTAEEVLTETMVHTAEEEATHTNSEKLN